MQYKSGVDFAGVDSAIWYACGVMRALYAKRGFTLVGTSFRDGVHSRASLHKSGFAVDIRIWNIPADVLNLIVSEGRLMLFPEGFDVVLESDHIHVEYDPTEVREWLTKVTEV